MEKILVCIAFLLLAVNGYSAQQYAIIHKGDVQHTVEAEGALGAQFGPKAIADLKPCPAEVVVGWHYDGLTFTPPTVEELAKQEAADLREARVTSLIDQIDKFLDVLESKGVIDANDVEVIQAAGQ